MRLHSTHLSREAMCLDLSRCRAFINLTVGRNRGQAHRAPVRRRCRCRPLADVRGRRRHQLGAPGTCPVLLAGCIIYIFILVQLFNLDLGHIIFCVFDGVAPQGPGACWAGVHRLVRVPLPPLQGSH
jgi:hypothetical protein